MHKSSRAGPLPSDWQIWCNHLHTIIGRVRFLPPSWGELSFSRELDRNHPYHHRDHRLLGRKGMASGQKKTPKAKPGAIVHRTMQLCDCYPMDTSTVAPEEWLLQKEAHKSSMVRCRVPSVLAPGWVSLGRNPPAHPSPGIAAAWGSLPFCAEQEQKLQSCSHSQDLFVCMHTALSLHHKPLQSASQKNRWLFNQIKDKVAFSKYSQFVPDSSSTATTR